MRKQGGVSMPKETYTFRYKREELAEIRDSLFKKNATRMVIVLVLASLLIIFAVFFHQSPIWFLVGGVFLIRYLMIVRKLKKNKKAWVDSEERVSSSTYQYEFFEDYFHVSVFQNEEFIKEYTILYTELSRISEIEKFFILQSVKGTFIIRKEDLQGGSVLYSERIRDNDIQEFKKIPGKWRVVSWVLVVASLFTIHAASFLILHLSLVNAYDLENSSAFFLFVPIPLTSIYLGKKLKERGYKYKKNTVVGIIMTIFLCLFGANGIGYILMHDYSGEYVIKVEDITDVEIPQAIRIRTRDWTKGTQEVAKGYIYFTSDIALEDEQAKVFEAQIEKDERWLSDVSKEIDENICSACFTPMYTYFLLYNTDTKEYNVIPQEMGTYRFIAIGYIKEMQEIEIVEYEIEYP